MWVRRVEELCYDLKRPFRFMMQPLSYIVRYEANFFFIPVATNPT